MKLSEVLDGTYCDAWGDAIDIPERYDAVKVAREMEAEVERLRAENAALRKDAEGNWSDYASASVRGVEKQLDAYRAAVAELRDLLAKGRLDGRDLSRMDAILDKLPKDAP